MKKTAAFLFLILILPVLLPAQNETFIYQVDDKFYKDCDEYYPMLINYSLLYEDSAGFYRVTTTMNQCTKVQGCNSCGISKNDYRKVISGQLRSIVNLGFNTIRLVGMAVNFQGEKNSEGRWSGTLATNSYYEFGTFGPKRLNCHKLNSKGVPLLGMEDYIRQGDLFEQVFEIIREEKLPLKVIVLIGGHGVELLPDEFSNYLSYIAKRFSSEPILMGYDLYNEPEYFQKASGKDYDKYDRANWFYSWYRAIKDQAPWHFVTYGPVISDFYAWDPEVMPADFVAYHVYSHPRESFNWSMDTAFISYKVNLKYFSENFSKKWILGETGKPGVDRSLYEGYDIHPVVTTLEKQREFVENSLKYVRWYGSDGFAWWLYKDAIWSKDNVDTETSKQYFQGLVNCCDNNTLKPAAYEFKKFDPFQPCNDCEHPSEKDFYNMFFYKYPVKNGVVFARQGSNKSQTPLKGAIVKAIVGKRGGKEKNHTCLTFSDDQGKFTIRSQYPGKDMVIKYIRISAAGMNNDFRENWGKGLSLGSPFYLEKLNSDKLPQIDRPRSELKISNEKLSWDSKRLLLETTLIVTKGAELTINDTLFVKGGSRIEVKDGGILKINGAIIGLCQWEGIDVLAAKNRGKKKKSPGGDVILGQGSVLKNSRYNIRRINTEADPKGSE